jgi:hypothetical protein
VSIFHFRMSTRCPLTVRKYGNRTTFRAVTPYRNSFKFAVASGAIFPYVSLCTHFTHCLRGILYIKLCTHTQALCSLQPAIDRTMMKDSLVCMFVREGPGFIQPLHCDLQDQLCLKESLNARLIICISGRMV